MYWKRGVPLYPVRLLGDPPLPPAIGEDEWNQSIAHDTERHSAISFEFWGYSREIVGDIMEYQFRLRFPIPVHLPRSAMKLILLFIAEDDVDLFGGEGLWLSPIEVYTFNWPRPFRWPLQTER